MSGIEAAHSLTSNLLYDQYGKVLRDQHTKFHQPPCAGAFEI